MLGTATEQLSLKLGQTLSGLLNASFGNAVEIIVGVAALMQGTCNVRYILELRAVYPAATYRGTPYRTDVGEPITETRTTPCSVERVRSYLAPFSPTFCWFLDAPSLQVSNLV